MLMTVLGCRNPAILFEISHQHKLSPISITNINGIDSMLQSNNLIQRMRCTHVNIHLTLAFYCYGDIATVVLLISLHAPL